LDDFWKGCVNTKRIIIPFLLLFAAYGVVGARLYYLQVWKREDLSRAARKQWLRVSMREPLKGSIYDRRGKLLAFSSFADSFYVNPSKLIDTTGTVAALADILSVDRSRLMRDITGASGDFVWAKRTVDFSTAQRLKERALDGVGWVQERRRFYPEEGLASSLIGLVGVDGQPLAGIELVVQDLLQEGHQREVIGRDAKGRGIEWDDSVGSELPTGFVYMTIDKTIQYVAEKEITEVFERTKARWACAIVQKVSTGEILAMAMCPGFSNSSPSEISAVSQLRNIAIGQVFEPGSTFKIIAAAAALEEGMVDPREVFDCENGEYSVADLTIHDHKPRGLLTFTEIIKYSSNIGVAKIGQRIGEKSLYCYARAFGFGSRTGVRLPGEASGILRKPSSWSGVTLPMMSFGQEVGVTCIQLVSAYAAIANGGTLYEPMIIHTVRNEKNDALWAGKPARIRTVISPASARELTMMLIEVVDGGTGQLAAVDGYSVAGKTGTAQKYDRELGRYSSSKHVASFCGFLPASRPEVAILVVVGEPEGLSWGGVVAGPVFSRIARQVVSYLNIPPDRPDIVRTASGHFHKT